MTFEGDQHLDQSQDAVVDTAKINEIQNYIDNLDDRESRNKFSEVLTKSVIDALKNMPDDIKAKLRDSFKEVYDKNKDDEDFQKLMKSISWFSEIFWFSIDSQWADDASAAEWADDASAAEWADDASADKWGDDASADKWGESVDVVSNVEWPKSLLVWSLGEIADGNEMRLTSKLVRNAPNLQDWQQDQTPSELRFYESFTDVGNQLTKVEALLVDDNLKDNKDLIWMKDSLIKIQKVMNNTTKQNVNELQKFIYSNLDDWEFKTKYKTLNHMRSNGIDFDWDFWVSTLAWLKILLDDKIKTFVTSMEEKLAQVKQQQAEKPEEPVEETEKPEEPVEETEKPEEPSIDTTPLTFNGGQHLVMWNSNDIASKAWLDGAIFYSWTLEEPQVEVWDDGKWQMREVPLDWNDYICLMQLKNHPGELYEVKVDKNGNICPIAKQIDLNLSTKSGDYLSTEVLISDNKSCKDYLKNKLPDEIKYCDIEWTDSNKDYIIKSHWKELTIEPMTIAGEWVCDSKDPNHLSKSLAFLNLTNYIRSVWDKYGNRDPNIKFDNDGLWIKWLRTPSVPRWKMHVNGFPENYGLEGATSDEKSAFKWYNNHERWRDDWDRKKENKIYKKI